MLTLHELFGVDDTLALSVTVTLPALTCILLLPQSATMMLPLTSTATPVGALN